MKNFSFDIEIYFWTFTFKMSQISCFFGFIRYRKCNKMEETFAKKTTCQFYLFQHLYSSSAAFMQCLLNKLRFSFTSPRMKLSLPKILLQIKENRFVVSLTVFWITNPGFNLGFRFQRIVTVGDFERKSIDWTHEIKFKPMRTAYLGSDRVFPLTQQFVGTRWLF